MSHCVHYYIANPPMETIESRRMSQYIQSKRFWVGFYLNLHFIWLDWIYFVTQSDLFKYWKLSVHPITWFKCTCEVILINLVCLVHCDMWFQLCGGYFCVAFIFIYNVGAYRDAELKWSNWCNDAENDMKKRMFYEDCRFKLFFFYFLLVWILRELIIGTDFFCVWYFI